MALFFRRLPKFQYVAAKTVDEAVSFLAEHKETARPIAGGTDLIPQLRRREAPAPAYVVDLKGISGLAGISYDEATGLRIGCLATIAGIAESRVVGDHFPILRQAALAMASPQVRNRGTFAGNICNAVPSADSVPALLTLDASVRLKNLAGERVVPLEQFFTGPRKTVIEPGEMLLEIIVPKPAAGSRGVYLKLSPRHAMDLAVVGVAVTGRWEKEICTDVRIALGAVAPTPVRAPVAEAMLRGQKVTPELIDRAAKNAITQCSPIDDHRASQEYRCDMVYVMTKRALNQVFFQ
jgi:CO/xanthine dehydrogenase FAD-binding subunit